MIADRSPAKAFTVFELLVAILVLMVVASFLLPALSNRHTGCRINCTNNLKQIGLSFKTWSLDNSDLLPMQVASTNGGARELTARGMVFPTFQAMSNELSTPKILICPLDVERPAATNFALDLTDQKLSYFLCQDPSDSGKPGILAGDRNLTNLLSPGKHYVAFTTQLILGWTKELHSRQGNVGLTDGSVGQFKNGELCVRRKGPQVQTNRLLVP